VRPGPFHYLKPRSLDHALAAIAAGAVPLAGGQSLLQAMRLRATEPQAIVDISGLEELDGSVRIDGDVLVIGALTTHRHLLEHSAINAEFPWLAKAARDLGDVQVRNRGTVLGNVCWADPRANMAVALLASDARITVAGGENPGTLPIAKFFTGFRENALRGGLATSIVLPRNGGARGSYIEFSRQRQDLALANVCVVQSDRGSAVAVGGLGQMPFRLDALENMLGRDDLDGDISHARIVQMIEALPLVPLRDHFGSVEYKTGLAATLVMRALAACRGGGDRVR